MIRTTFLLLLSTAAAFPQGSSGAAPAQVHSGDVSPAVKFSAPELLTAGGEPVAVSAPGYASPTWFDVNSDGVKDLVVGQYQDGKMKVYLAASDGALQKGDWLMAGDTPAMVPGIQ